MTLEKKIARAKLVIRQALADAKKPAFMCSFGKDSMVLLDVLHQMGERLPIIFHRDPWWPNKYEFADRMIREMKLEVHDYPPSAVTLWEGKEIMAFTNHYQIGRTPQSYLQLPKNILPPVPGRGFLCGLRDVLARPTGTFNYPWDLVFIGHKSSDSDQIAGKVPLHVDVKQNYGAAPDAAFPLRSWTDSDVWDYTQEFAIPQQEDRYQDRTELPDKTNNSDYAHVCIACCDRRTPDAVVRCPVSNLEVSNVSRMVPYAEPKFDYFGAK